MPHTVNRLPAGGHNARIAEPISRTAHIQPTRLHGATARIEVVPEIAFLQPTRAHGARRAQMVPRASVLPTREHRARRIKQVPIGTHALPPRGHSAIAAIGEPIARTTLVKPAFVHRVSARIKPIPRAVDGILAQHKRARRSGIAPNPVARTPARSHGARALEEIPAALDCFQARCHSAARVGVKVIPGSLDTEPTHSHCSRPGIEIIPMLVGPKPAGLHPARRVEVVPLVVNLRPAVRGIAAVSVSIPPFRPRFNPMVAVDGLHIGVIKVDPFTYSRNNAIVRELPNAISLAEIRHGRIRQATCRVVCGNPFRIFVEHGGREVRVPPRKVCIRPHWIARRREFVEKRLRDCGVILPHHFRIFHIEINGESQVGARKPLALQLGDSEVGFLARLFGRRGP